VNAQEIKSPHEYGIAPPVFRLPDGTRVGAVRLRVADLQRSLDYYRRVIGLQLLTSSPDTAALGAPGASRPLVVLHAVPGTKPAPRRGTFGLYHFAILLPDRASLGRFATHLRSLGLSPGIADHLVSEALYLTDPDGLGIEVYADRPRNTWRHAERQLEMATDPLDLADLIRAGAAEAWTGAPAGTTVGHIHLHVGNLEQAASFYHRALGFDVTVWNYPGALFLSAGGYHHHLGTNTWSPGPAPAANQARLLEWELVVPTMEAARSAAQSLEAGGYSVTVDGNAWTTADPWGTPLRILAV